MERSIAAFGQTRSMEIHTVLIPACDGPEAAANGATVEVSSAFSVVHASLVSTRINGPPTSTGGGQITLPTGLATFDPDALLTLPAVLTVYKEDSPVLILSSQRLRWANAGAFETAKP